MMEKTESSLFLFLSKNVRNDFLFVFLSPFCVWVGFYGYSVFCGFFFLYHLFLYLREYAHTIFFYCSIWDPILSSISVLTL